MIERESTRKNLCGCNEVQGGGHGEVVPGCLFFFSFWGVDGLTYMTTLQVLDQQLDYPNSKGTLPFFNFTTDTEVPVFYLIFSRKGARYTFIPIHPHY